MKTLEMKPRICHCGEPLAKHADNQPCQKQGTVIDPLATVVSLKAMAVGSDSRTRARLEFLVYEASKGKLAL